MKATDIVVSGGIFLIILLIIVPLNALFLDFLLIISISLSVVVLLLSLPVNHAPSAVLIRTRLARTLPSGISTPVALWSACISTWLISATAVGIICFVLSFDVVSNFPILTDLLQV